MCNKGENIFRIDLDKSEESLKKLPYIKDCRVRRDFPDGIIIEIAERKDAAAIFKSGSVIYIDEEGYVLSIEEQKDDISLPLILGLEQIDYEIGRNIFDETSIENIEEFIVYSKELNLLDIIKQMDFSDEKNIIIGLNSGTNVAFGPLNNVKYKLSFLNKMLEDIDNKNIKAKQILFNKGENPIIVRDNR